MASIHPIARARSARPQPLPAATGLAQGLPSRIHFWRGASGQRHRCAVYGLYECPPLPDAVYLLVQRAPEGRRKLLDAGRIEEGSPTLNLALLRHLGATLGANEVHVALLGSTADRRQKLAADLAADGHVPHLPRAEVHATLM